MNFILTISLNPDAGNKKSRVSIQFEGDDNMPFEVVLRGLKTFLDAAEAKQKMKDSPMTLGELFELEGEG